jgi:hypothetical protein
MAWRLIPALIRALIAARKVSVVILNSDIGLGSVGLAASYNGWN